jgi:hypothetical protein
MSSSVLVRVGVLARVFGSSGAHPSPPSPFEGHGDEPEAWFFSFASVSFKRVSQNKTLPSSYATRRLRPSKTHHASEARGSARFRFFVLPKGFGAFFFSLRRRLLLRRRNRRNERVLGEERALIGVPHAHASIEARHRDHPVARARHRDRRARGTVGGGARRQHRRRRLGGFSFF